jgi:hypothetical protein
LRGYPFVSWSAARAAKATIPRQSRGPYDLSRSKRLFRGRWRSPQLIRELEVLPSCLTMMTAPRTLHSHLVWPTYNIWSIELLPRVVCFGGSRSGASSVDYFSICQTFAASLGRLATFRRKIGFLRRKVAMRHLGVITILIHVNCEFKAAMQPRGTSSFFSDNPYSQNTELKLRPF